MARFLLIRHGKTRGNLERRYIGDATQPLCDEGVAAALTLAGSGVLPAADTLLCGPAKRCRQTARLLFPDLPYSVCQMSEIDFGVFKNKNAEDLSGDETFRAWLDTGCMGDIPGGDSVAAFKERCCGSFLQIAEKSVGSVTAMVIHGGNIMAILERFALPSRGFFDYHVPNCGFFLCRFENGALYIEREGP